MELEPRRQFTPDGTQDPLVGVVVDALAVLQQPSDNDTNDPQVQLREHGFGGQVYLGDQVLSFTDALPGSADIGLNREPLRAKGFTDAEIDSGISSLTTGRSNDGTIIGRTFIAGLLDPQSSIRVLRQQEDDQYTDSDLSVIEKLAIVRLAFLSQLVGYVSERYSTHSPDAAVDAFIEELEANGLEGAPLRNMFQGRSLPGLLPQEHTTPTLGEDLNRFDELIGNYRWRLSPDSAAPRSTTYEASKLVENGGYLRRILISLGFVASQSIEKPPLALEPIE